MPLVPPGTPDDSPTADAATQPHDNELPLTDHTSLEQAGGFIGPYKLLSVIGEGGFGTVWLAERREPMVQRVALKVIKAGMDTKAVIARFEQERQALAVMDHPNVAKVFDAGATPNGRPYFVMEHVPGEPITVFCDRHNYTIARRLELFATACEAVQHAHHKGIIHRDIKPSNVLVAIKDDHAIVKVIDFGVAKAISQTLTEKTIFTETGQLIGTPEYMSPEQAEMGALDIDTRTDVYSLGVLLYELLTGLLPFDSVQLRSKGFAEIQRIIREVDPPTPSKRLTGIGDEQAAAIARARHAERHQIAGELRRELEWIPLKALSKDRTTRYATPNDLAEEVRRYVRGERITAAPMSRRYRLHKAVSRNRIPLSWTMAFFAVFLIALAVIARDAHQRSSLVNARQRALAELSYTTGFQAGSFTSLSRFPPRSLEDALGREDVRDAIAVYRKAFSDRPKRYDEVREGGPESLEEVLGDFTHARGLTDTQILALLFGGSDEKQYPQWLHRRIQHSWDAERSVAELSKWSADTWEANAPTAVASMNYVVSQLVERYRDQRWWLDRRWETGSDHSLAVSSYGARSDLADLARQIPGLPQSETTTKFLWNGDADLLFELLPQAEAMDALAFIQTGLERRVLPPADATYSFKRWAVVLVAGVWYSILALFVFTRWTWLKWLSLVLAFPLAVFAGKHTMMLIYYPPTPLWLSATPLAVGLAVLCYAVACALLWRRWPVVFVGVGLAMGVFAGLLIASGVSIRIAGATELLRWI